jgi:hypothetical protein
MESLVCAYASKKYLVAKLALLYPALFLRRHAVISGEI